MNPDVRKTISGKLFPYNTCMPSYKELPEDLNTNNANSDLQLKSVCPNLPPNFISRPQLVEVINTKVNSKLLTILAPAGFGKTTLLSEWASQAASHVLWVSLDKYDRPLHRFWGHIIVALETLQPGLGEVIPPQSFSDDCSTYAFTALIRELSAISYQVTIILDNYSAIDTASIHQGILFLIDHLPQHINIIIASRMVSPLPLAHLRAQGQLSELHADDLRFTPAEIELFLCTQRKERPSPMLIEKLESDTGGWITGLYLITQYLHDHSSPTALYMHDQKENYTYLWEYIYEEIFSQLPQQIQDFLLQTSAFHHLTNDSCKAIVGYTLLEWLEENALFLARSHIQASHYVYLPVFRDFLFDRLCRTQPNLLPYLKHRIQSFFEQNGLIIEAIEYALATSQFDHAVSLINQSWEAIIEHGEMTLLYKWLSILPLESTASSERLSLLSVWYTFIQQQIAHTEPWWCEYMHATFLAVPDNLYLEDAFCWSLPIKNIHFKEVLGTLSVSLWAEPLPSLEQAHILIQSTKNDIFLHMLALINLGVIYWHLHDIEQAMDTVKRTNALAFERGYTSIYLVTFFLLAQIHTACGQGTAAIRLYELMLDFSGRQNLPFTPLLRSVYIQLGQLYYEQNELNVSFHLLEKGITQSEQHENQEQAIYCNALIARIKMAQNNEAEAMIYLKNAEQNLQLFPASANVRSYVNMCRVKLLLKKGMIKMAQYHFDQMVADQSTCIDPVFLLQVLVALNRLDEAAETIRELTSKTQNVRKKIELDIIQMNICYQKSQKCEAAKIFEQMRLFRYDQLYYRIFLDEMPYLADMIIEYEKIASREKEVIEDKNDVLKEYKVKNEYDVKNDNKPQKSKKKGKHDRDDKNSSDMPSVLDQHLGIELHERELEVLLLVSEGLSNQEIARDLKIAKSTVKWHIKNIYEKLYIKNRAQAIILVHKLLSDHTKV